MKINNETKRKKAKLRFNEGDIWPIYIKFLFVNIGLLITPMLCSKANTQERHMSTHTKYIELINIPGCS